MEYSTILNILLKNAVIYNSYAIEPGKSIRISAIVAIIWIKSSLGDVVFMGANGIDGAFLVANDNYCCIYGAKTPGKVNVYSETGADIIYIENYTDATVRFFVTGFIMRGLDE